VSIPNIAAAQAAAIKAVNEVTITDIHTHLFPPSHGKMMDWGIDQLLTYHYLISELFTVAPADLTPEAFWKLSKAQHAELVWEHVFLRHGPISEAARGVLTCLNSLGIDTTDRKLSTIRKFYQQQNIDEFLPKVFRLAGLDYAVMTNDPFEPDELPYLEQDLPCPEQLKTALRVDTLIMKWSQASAMMRKQGYDAADAVDARGLAVATKFLIDWAGRMKPRYMAASLPPEFRFPADCDRTKIFEQAVIPAARATGLPVALMIGVRRQVNPALRAGGDGMGPADIDSVQNMCQAFGDVKFLVTVLCRDNQHQLAVLGRKFPRNLHVFGCWWFCNTPSAIEEITRMRMELLGTACTLQHSDARVLDQLVYKWNHSRQVIGRVFADKVRDLWVAGWRPTEEEIRRDARHMLGGGFEEFCKR
jgi:hypothetical protein